MLLVVVLLIFPQTFLLTETFCRKKELTFKKKMDVLSAGCSVLRAASPPEQTLPELICIQCVGPLVWDQDISVTETFSSMQMSPEK